MQPLATYLKELTEIRASGVAQLCQEASITGMHLSLTDGDRRALAVVILER